MTVTGERRPGGAGPYKWEPDPEHSEGWILHRDDVDRVSRFKGKGVVEHCRTMYRKEKEVQAALGSEEPRALCNLGWHRLESVDADPVFFKFMSGRSGCRLNFWLGSEPVEWTATKIAGLGTDAVPWHCTVCGRVVPNLEPSSS
jgi:hypothetical protein